MAEKLVDLYAPANEAEADAFCDLLKDNGIAGQKMALGSSAYPNIAYQGWGVVRVAESDLEKGQELLTEWLKAGEGIDDDKEPELPQAKIALDSSRARGLRVVGNAKFALFGVLFIGSVILNGVLLAKHYKGRPTIETVYDIHGQPIARYYYASKYSEHPRRIDLIDKSNQVSSASYDEDENGWFEYAETHYDGAVTWQLYDSDENGHYEKQYRTRDGVRVAMFEDTNADGILDVGKKLTMTATTPVLRDVDGDGFYELFNCERNGNVVASTKLTCPLMREKTPGN